MKMHHRQHMGNRLTSIRKSVAILCVFTVCSFALGGISHAGLSEKLEAMISPDDAVLVTAPDGNVLYSKNATRLLIPASTLKVLTALAALHYLGPDFRFSTEFYLTPRDVLIIKGYGDPLLISEQVNQAAAEIARLNITFSSIAVDHSYFLNPLRIPGVSTTSEPYDSPNGALCVNFNTVCFRRQNGTYISDEPQTPLLPYALKRIQPTGMDQGRITLSHDEHDGAVYAGHLFQYFMNRQGMSSITTVVPARVEKNLDQLVHTHVSGFTLTEAVAKLMEFSNNFIANQIMISTGAAIYGPPGTLDKGIDALESYARDIMDISEVTVVEGSGISRDNRISAKSMHRLLAGFKPYHRLMRHNGNEYFKTGTLTGIRTRAGYIETPDRGLYDFVVFLNSPGKSYDSIMKMIHHLVESDGI